MKVTDGGGWQDDGEGRGLGVGLARTGSIRIGGGMKRKAWIGLLGLAVAMVPLALWWYRMERNATA